MSRNVFFDGSAWNCSGEKLIEFMEFTRNRGINIDRFLINGMDLYIQKTWENFEIVEALVDFRRNTKKDL